MGIWRSSSLGLIVLVIALLAADLAGEAARPTSIHSDFERFAVRSSRGYAHLRKKRMLISDTGNTTTTSSTTTTTTNTTTTSSNTTTGGATTTSGNTTTGSNTTTGGTTTTGGSPIRTSEPLCPYNNMTLCGTMCVDLSSSTNNCGSCSTMCTVGWGCCNKICTTMMTDKKNCGACGKKCSGTCVAGVCNYGGVVNKSLI